MDEKFDIRVYKQPDGLYYLAIISWFNMDVLVEKHNLTADNIFEILKEYKVINNFEITLI